MDVKNLQSRDNEDQSDAQLEHHLQAKRQRQVDGGEDADRTGAPASTGAHMQVESHSDFLQPQVSQERSPANPLIHTTMRSTMT